MKPHFSQLTPEQQANFGDGCSFVPDFAFEKTCRRHDWFYSIGCGANHWYENIWKAPYHKISEDLRLGYYAIKDSLRLRHWFFTPVYIFFAILYSVSLILLPISWFFFTYGKWRDAFVVVQIDQEKKGR